MPFHVFFRSFLGFKSSFLDLFKVGELRKVIFGAIVGPYYS